MLNSFMIIPLYIYIIQVLDFAVYYKYKIKIMNICSDSFFYKNDTVCVILKCQDILIVTTNINCFNKENNKNYICYK